MKKVIEELNIFRTYFRVRQEVSDEIQASISFIKYELQTSIENNISCKQKENKGKIILVELEWTKIIAHYESYRISDHKYEQNIR